MKEPILYTASCIAVAMSLMVSCKKDPVQQTLFTASAEALVSDSKIAFDPGSGSVGWTSTDDVKVYDAGNNSAILRAVPDANTDGATASLVLPEGTFTTSSAPFSAICPASSALSASAVRLPATQTSSNGGLMQAPMYAHSATDHLAFKHLCGVVVLNLQAYEGATASISSVSLEATAHDTANPALPIYVSGDYNIALDSASNPILTPADGQGGNTVTLTCSSPVALTARGHNFCLFLPPADYTALSVAITTTDGRSCVKRLLSSDSAAFLRIRRGHAYRFSFAGLFSNAPEGALCLPFTVDSLGSKVWFSRGNLQYQPSTDTWRFASEQYSCGAMFQNLRPRNTSTKWLDLFCWGTSGWESGAAIYRPWDYGPVSTGYLHHDLTGQYAEADWAWHNPISNGGNAPHLWRTPTADEWQYLIDNHVYNNVSIKMPGGEDTLGFVILPDGFVDPMVCSNTPDGAFPPNINDPSVIAEYTLENWMAMESAGALYLPSVGIRRDNALGVIDLYTGYYWSTTMQEQSSALGVFYWGIFLRTYTHQLIYEKMSYGCSVRPVSDVR